MKTSKTTSAALAMILTALVGNSAFAITLDPDVPPPIAAVQIIPSTSAQAAVVPTEAAITPQASSVANPELRPVQIVPESAPQVVRPVAPRPAARPQAARPQATRPAARPAVSANQDEASRVFDLCVAQENRTKRSAVRCISRATSRAEASIDSTETRVLNCRELRKSEADMSQASMIDSLVDGRMFQLRLEDDNGFKSMVSAAGKIGPRKTAEIELRATLNHLENISKLANKVCDSAKFTQLLAK